MKKLVFMFVAIAAISFASCGGNSTKKEAPVADTTDTASVDTASVDTASTAQVDTTVAK